MHEAASAVFPDAKFELIAVDAESDGPEPFGEESTLGQINVSLQKIMDIYKDATYYVSILNVVISPKN